MGLTRAALIFAAGYILGRPEGRAKVAELAKRPEVTQLREQAASTVSSGLKSGKEQLTKATGRADKVSDQDSSTSNGSGPGYSDPRRRRLPSFPRRGARPARSGVTTTAPVGTTPATPTSGGTSTSPVADDPVSTGTAPTVTTPHQEPRQARPIRDRSPRPRLPESRRFGPCPPPRPFLRAAPTR